MMREQSLQLMHRTRVVSRLANRKLALGFGGWVAAVAPREDSTSKALLYFVNREMARSWVSWHTRWAVLSARRESMRKSVGYLLIRDLSRGWSAWYLSWIEHLVHHPWVEHLVLRKLAHGWRGWHWVWMAGKTKQQAIRQSLGRLLDGGLTYGFGACRIVV